MHSRVLSGCAFGAILLVAIVASSARPAVAAEDFDRDACYINPYGLTPAMFPTTYDGYKQAKAYIIDKGDAYRNSAPKSPTGACMRAHCERAEARARAQLFQEFVRNGILEDTGRDKEILADGEKYFHNWADLVVGKCGG